MSPATLRRRFADLGDDPAPLPLAIETGSLADYAALAHLHYRAARPATVARVLVAIDRRTGERAGALVVSMPTLNARWRALAWPGRFDPGTLGKRDAARRLNAELRTVSRLVVDPRLRGLGVGRRLVRAYLDHPLTHRTEAVAAMGACCPVFARAGMRERVLGPTARDRRLLEILDRLRVPLWRLADTAGVLGRTRGRSLELLDEALRRWCDASRATRRLAGAPIEDRLRAASQGARQETYVYTHDSPARRA